MVKFLSNFDSNLDKKLFAHYVEKHSEEQCLLVRRDRLFLLTAVVLPSILLLIVTIGAIILRFLSIENVGIRMVVRSVVVVTWIVIAIRIGQKIVINLIDYHLDFAIATPHELISYNQEGLFHRLGQTIQCDKIKTVSVRKEGVLKSIFNVGTIVVLSEGDDHGKGNIEITYVHNPDKVSQQMRSIFNANVQ